MTEQAFAAFNYVVLGLALMFFTLKSMRDIYVPKRSLLLGLVYYVFKFLIDFFFYVRQSGMTDGVRLLGFAWGMLTICLVFPLCILLFWGSTAELYANITIINVILSIAQLVSFYLANALLGKPFGTSFQESYGPGTILSLLILSIEFLCLRKPMAWMARGIQHFPHRYQVLLAELVFLGTAGFIAMLYQPESGAGFAMAYRNIILLSVVPLLAIAWLQILLSRRARAQTLYLQHIETLTTSYMEKIVDQLAIAERDRMLFDGLGPVLDSVGEQSGSSELLEQIAQLDKEYERIVQGTYSENPVYDAFLCAIASRLENRGVRPVFSMAALAPTIEMRPQLVLILLSEVDRLVAHAKEAAGCEVNLRIRSLNGMMHIYLDMPSPWGHLRARQLLDDAGFGDTVLVRERVQDRRTEVLVLSQEGNPCSSS